MNYYLTGVFVLHLLAGYKHKPPHSIRRGWFQFLSLGIRVVVRWQWDQIWFSFKQNRIRGKHEGSQALLLQLKITLMTQ